MPPRWRVAIVCPTDARRPAWLDAWQAHIDFEWFQVDSEATLPPQTDIVLTPAPRHRSSQPAVNGQLAETPELISLTQDDAWELTSQAETPGVGDAHGQSSPPRVTLFANTPDASVVEIARLAGQLSELSRRVQTLEEEVDRDPLTGLWGRRGWDRFVQKIANSTAPLQPFAVAILDLDRFKGINETQGLAVGDQILQLVAGQLRAALTPHEQLARWGGDEFVVALPVSDSFEAGRRVDALRRVCGEPPSPVTASAGWVFASEENGISHDNCDVTSLFRQADEGLRRAKLSGGNRCEPGI
jgi:diguanylate cyclase (GGDEF)-like protein